MHQRHVAADLAAGQELYIPQLELGGGGGNWLT